jgi:hypothetical protein
MPIWEFPGERRFLADRLTDLAAWRAAVEGMRSPVWCRFTGQGAEIFR